MENKWVKKSKVFSKRWFLLVFLFLLIIIPLTAGTLWVKWALAAPDKSGKEKIFVIAEAESTVSIAKRLKDQGLIKDINAFRLYTRISCTGVSLSNPATLLQKYPAEQCLSGNIQAGSFKLSGAMDLPTLATALTRGRLDSWTKILEGLRNEEIAAVLAKNYHIKEEEFLKIAKIGYLFPDTYLFKTNSTAQELVDKMQATFDLKVTPELREQIKSQGLTLSEGVTLASILERETNSGDERPMVAGILLKRMREGWKLEADATVQFAIGYDQEGKTWWKKGLTDNDLQSKSPYNTRKILGLPPGPICNPGLSSLKAVGKPVASGYYYYLHDSNGKIHYAKTLDEHNQNRAKFL